MFKLLCLTNKHKFQTHILQCFMVELWGVNPNGSSKGQTKRFSKHGHKLTFFTYFLVPKCYLLKQIASAIWISSVLQSVCTLLVILCKSLPKLILQSKITCKARHQTLRSPDSFPMNVLTKLYSTSSNSCICFIGHVYWYLIRWPDQVMVQWSEHCEITSVRSGRLRRVLRGHLVRK